MEARGGWAWVRGKREIKANEKALAKHKHSQHSAAFRSRSQQSGEKSIKFVINFNPHHRNQVSGGRERGREDGGDV